MSAQPAHVLILTALDVEYQAVRGHLTRVTTERHSAGTLFEVGELGSSSCRVAIGLTGSGNTNAAVIAERAIAMFTPQALLYVGIAGALHDDLAVGDIVFATKVYAYHGGRADDTGFLAAPDAWHPAHEIDQLAHQLVRTRDWRSVLPARDERRAFCRPIAAGEVVLNSTTNPLRDQLRQHYTDAAAIEMESAGAARAGQLNRSLPTATIRGISDRADGRKYDSDAGGHQERAMVGAAAFAVALVELLPLRPLPVADASARLAATEVQSITAHGGLAAGALHGNVYIHAPTPAATPGPARRDVPVPWQPLPQPADVVWRTERLRRQNPFERAALELHLVPTEQVERIPFRQLAELPAHLAEVGRRDGLFPVALALDLDSDERSAWATLTAFDQGPAGFAVERLGQRSVWRPLPADNLGSIVDEDDLVVRLTTMLVALASLPLPAAAAYAPAVGIEPAASVSRGRVAELPRNRATFSLAMKPHVRIAPDESVPADRLATEADQIAAELTARVLAAMRG